MTGPRVSGPGLLSPVPCPHLGRAELKGMKVCGRSCSPLGGVRCGPEQPVAVSCQAVVCSPSRAQGLMASSRQGTCPVSAQGTARLWEPTWASGLRNTSSRPFRRLFPPHCRKGRTLRSRTSLAAVLLLVGVGLTDSAQDLLLAVCSGSTLGDTKRGPLPCSRFPAEGGGASEATPLWFTLPGGWSVRSTAGLLGLGSTWPRLRGALWLEECGSGSPTGTGARPATHFAVATPPASEVTSSLGPVDGLLRQVHECVLV